MLGAIAGDIIGSIYEAKDRAIKSTDFPLFSAESRFTDDTVLTIAAAECQLKFGREGIDFGDSSALKEAARLYAHTMQIYGRRFPNAGYGANFRRWIFADVPQPYGSFGNGAAMRVSPIAFAGVARKQSLDDTLADARLSAAITHDHEDGHRGARAVAAVIHLARNGKDKDAIRAAVSERFEYDLTRTTEEIRKDYSFDVSAQGSVPEAMLCFLESSDFETAVRLAVSLGGDADTQACMAGAMAQAFYGPVPDAIAHEVHERLPPEFRGVLERFEEMFGE